MEMMADGSVTESGVQMCTRRGVRNEGEEDGTGDDDDDDNDDDGDGRGRRKSSIVFNVD